MDRSTIIQRIARLDLILEKHPVKRRPSIRFAVIVRAAASLQETHAIQNMKILRE
jgi:hypothetical protein